MSDQMSVSVVNNSGVPFEEAAAAMRERLISSLRTQVTACVYKLARAEQSVVGEKQALAEAEAALVYELSPAGDAAFAAAVAAGTKGN